MTYTTGPALLHAWSIEPVPYDDASVRQLLSALHDEQRSLYGFADNPAETPAAQFAPPKGLFLLIRQHDGTALGCGGWRLLEPGIAEIKRMYVRPAVRGLSLGRQILVRLESDAKRRGAHSAQLETGVDNHAALALYRGQAYLPINAYQPGRNPSVNRALRKDL